MLSLGSLVTGFAPTTVRPSTINAQMGLLDAVKGIFGDKKQVSASDQTSDIRRSALLKGAPTSQRGRNGQKAARRRLDRAVAERTALASSPTPPPPPAPLSRRPRDMHRHLGLDAESPKIN